MKHSILAVAGAALLLSAGTAIAQPAATPAPAPAAHAPHVVRPGQVLQRNVQRLRTVLQLRPDQEPAFQALIASLRPESGVRPKIRSERLAMRNVTTPEKLDLLKTQATERMAQFDRRAAAIKQFYAQLTPAQQKALDVLPDGRRERGMMMFQILRERQKAEAG
jgi:Spy/CpxP family protein refolding chaperone